MIIPNRTKSDRYNENRSYKIDQKPRKFENRWTQESKISQPVSIGKMFSRILRETWILKATHDRCKQTSCIRTVIVVIVMASEDRSGDHCDDVDRDGDRWTCDRGARFVNFVPLSKYKRFGLWEFYWRFL